MANNKVGKIATGTMLLFCFFVLLEAALGGVASVLIKQAMESLPVFYLLALRFTIASAAFLLLFGMRLLKKIASTAIKPILVISFFTAAGFILSNLALQHTTATNTGFLYSLSVVFTPFVAKLVFKDRFNFKMLPVVAVVTFGMYLLCGGASFAFGLGELLALSCAVLSAFNVVLSAKYLKDTDWVVLSFFQVFSSMVVCWPLAIGLKQIVPLYTVEPSVLWAVLFLGLGCSFLIFILQNLALQRLSATLVSLILCSESVFSAAAAYLVLGERLDTAGYIGAGIIVAGIVAATLLGRRDFLPPAIDP